MDVIAVQTSAVVTDGEVVWSWPLDAEVCATRQRRVVAKWGQESRSPGRARRTPLKRSRREGRGRTQAVVATPSVFIPDNNSSSASAGVFHPSVFLGRELSAAATAAISSAS